MQIAQPKFGGIYQLNIKKADGSEVGGFEGLVTNKLRNGKLEGRVPALEQVSYGNKTYIILDDEQGNHLTQLGELRDRFPQAFMRNCWGPRNSELQKRIDRDFAGYMKGFNKLMKETPTGEIRVTFEEKPLAPGSRQLFDAVEIREIDIRA